MTAYVRVDSEGNIIGASVGPNIVVRESDYDYKFKLDRYIDPVDLVQFWKVESGELIKK